jgi:hypothetical protein
MMTGTDENDPDQAESEEIVLPQWLDVEKLQTDILIKEFTQRGFSVLNMDLAAREVVLNQSCVKYVDHMFELTDLRSINIHTLAFLAAARYQAQQYEYCGFGSLEWSLLEMMTGPTKSQEIVLPQWFDIEQLQTDILIKEFTDRGCSFLHMNDGSDFQFKLSWGGDRYPSAYDFSIFEQNGWTFHPPIDNEYENM